MTAADPYWQHEVLIYTEGLAAMSVCAPAYMPVEEVTAVVNRKRPVVPGTTLAWSPSGDTHFADGLPQPGPCDKLPDLRRHYLFQC